MGLLSDALARAQNLLKGIQLKTDEAIAWSAGQLSYDVTTKTILADTGFSGVRVNIGQETHIRFFNDTGGQIANGKPVNATGVDATNNVMKGIILDASSPATSSVFIGLATADVEDGDVGLATIIGEVRGFDTSGLAEGGIVYAGTSGVLTNTFQNFPSRVVIVGTCVKSDADGIVLVKATESFVRATGSKSYSFTQANVGAGVYFSGGFYEAPAADLDLDQGSLTANFGSTDVAYAAHAFCVSSGNGTVDAGVVGLRVNGTSITDEGVLTALDTEVLSVDITAEAADSYIETPKKWLGVVEYELYTVSGSPVNFSFSFNYGYAKYEDLANNDFTVTGVEVVGTAAANDTAFNIELLHHQATGWTYSAAAFVAGNGNIAAWTTDMTPRDNLINGQPFAWKRTNLSTFVNGDAAEGILMRITAAQTNSVQSMDLHITGVIEELIY
jgi:hypothetical protein